jgi:hypothetical protein
MPFRWGSGPGCKAAGRQASFPTPSGTPVRLRIYVMTGYRRSRPLRAGGMVQAVFRYRFQKQRGSWARPTPKAQPVHPRATRQ